MKHRQIFIFILALIVLASCNDGDPVKPVTPPDPCAGKHPVSADFDMYETEWSNMSIKKNDGDSIDCNNYLTLIAKDSCDYYEWQIEGDTTKYYTRKKVIWFGGRVNPTVRVRLITRSVPNLSCFPNDDGADTVIQRITVSNILNCKIFGIYRGANLDSPLDSFNITIKRTEYAPGGHSYGVQLINFPRGCYDDSTFNNFYSKWKPMYFYNVLWINRIPTAPPFVTGKIVYDPKTDKLRIDYELGDLDNPEKIRTAYIYEGIKIGDN